MPGHRVRDDADPAQGAVEQQADGDDPEAVPSDVADPRGARTDAGQAEVGGHVVHPGVEVALQAREDEGRPPAAREQRLRREPQVAAPPPRAALGHRPAGQGEPLGGRVDDAEPDAARLRMRTGRVEARHEHGRVVGVQQGGEPLGAVGGEHEDALGLVHRERRHGARRLFQDHVGVDAAEAEGVDGGAADGPVGGGLPGRGLLQRTEPGGRERGVRVVAVEGGQEHAVVDGQGRLDQARDTRGGHGVADHRLDGADDRPLVRLRARPEHIGQRGQFGPVPGRGGGAVGLQQADRPGFGGIETGGPPGLAYGVGLAAGVGVDQTRRAAVAGDAGAADDGVDAVAVALGVGEPLEDDHAGALADEDAVGGAVEGADALARGKRAELGEDAPQGDVVAVVHSPASIRSQRPEASSPTAWSTATSEDAHAASTV